MLFNMWPCCFWTRVECFWAVQVILWVHCHTMVLKWMELSVSCTLNTRKGVCFWLPIQAPFPVPPNTCRVSGPWLRVQSPGTPSGMLAFHCQCTALNPHRGNDPLLRVQSPGYLDLISGSLEGPRFKTLTLVDLYVVVLRFLLLLWIWFLMHRLDTDSDCTHDLCLDCKWEQK